MLTFHFFGRVDDQGFCYRSASMNEELTAQQPRPQQLPFHFLLSVFLCAEMPIQKIRDETSRQGQMLPHHDHTEMSLTDNLISATLIRWQWT